MSEPSFSFRNDGPSGHGAGRIRYYVDLGSRCIGSVEGLTGDFRLDADYRSPDGAAKETRRYRTRVDAAQALAELTAIAEQPPISAAEYRILQRCKKSDTFAMPLLGFARILSSRGLLLQKRGTGGFRTTAMGLKMIERYERWATEHPAETQGEHR